MKEEQWIQKIRERLDDYTEPLPASGWERLEQGIMTRRTSVTRKRFIMRRLTMAAAAALIGGIVSIGLWLLNGSVGEDIRHTNAAALAIINNSQPVIPLTGGTTGIDFPTNDGIPSRTIAQSLIADTPLPMYESSEALEKTEEEPEKTIKKNEAPAATENQGTTVSEETQPPVKKRKSLEVPEAFVSGKKTDNGWSMGLSIANVGGLGSMLNDDRTDAIYQDMSVAGMEYSSFDLLDASNGILAIPNDKNLVFKDGIPYLESRSRKIASIHHKQPISFGLSLRKNLPRNFSIETGLTYTYLSSEVTFTDGSQKFDQRLHYIGIPLRANWNFVNKESFILYLSGGGTVEKCIHGKIGSETETVKPVQLSVMGTVGAQYNINRKVGIYVEPGIAYFFDDGSSIQTIRKESPCNFTLQAGLRLSY